MKRVITAVVVLSILGLASFAFGAEGAKLGYVDMQKALNLSEAGKGAKEQLAAKVKKYQDEINAKQDELKKLKDDLEKQSVLLSETARVAKEKDYQQKLKEFQRFTKDAQDELQAKDEEFTRKIIEDLERVIQDYGRKNGYTFIFVRNDSMAYVDDKADLTEEVLKLFNESRKK
ncbi:OmpH outer membrane protein [Geotalea uraniireducens]|uniref:OmpH outer membrane protein n=1 Tax=Geotalea uraniireducens TaxID=351604 RepID=A0ABN6VQE9_9BACT|nr:OmpH family outer membrane protein [Geotalea uraniireducens]BDV42535.1 OmpH outer membrane protein [Geotalea uraniireducens]